MICIGVAGLSTNRLHRTNHATRDAKPTAIGGKPNPKDIKVLVGASMSLYWFIRTDHVKEYLILLLKQVPNEQPLEKWHINPSTGLCDMIEDNCNHVVSS